MTVTQTSYTIADNYPPLTNTLVSSYNNKTQSKKTNIFAYLNSDLPYLPLSGCVFEHILLTPLLTHKDKLFYLIADSLSLINAKNTTKQRSIALSSATWAEKLNCSKNEIFSIQKNLEKNGYFVIIRDKNKYGKNKRNVIIPTIPDLVFNQLSKEPELYKNTNSNLLSSAFLSALSSLSPDSPYYVNSMASKRSYLDSTKLFIKLNYQLLSFIVSSDLLSDFAKLVWLNFYSICYKSSIKNFDLIKSHYTFTISYFELQNIFGCSKTTLSKTLNQLKESGFLTKNRFYVKNNNENDNLHDKSLWTITLSIPTQYQQQLLELKPRTNEILTDNISCTDPYVSKIGHILNKDFIINNYRDSDNIDRGKNFFENLDDLKNLSELSVSSKNSPEEEKKETVIVKPKEDSNNSLQDKSIIQFDTKESREENNISARPKLSSDKDSVTTEKTLKSFYPLTTKQVDKLNSLSRRRFTGGEYSVNFANQLLLKLHVRDPKKIFPSKNHMMSYMSKAFLYELHQAPMVNHESFRFTANVSNTESVAERQKEKYLSEVEYSLDTSHLSRLRRKIASIFESKLAYRLLTEVEYKLEYQEVEESQNQQYLSIHQEVQQQDWKEEQESQEFKEFKKLLSDTSIKEYTCTIQLPEDLVLIYHQEEILENAIKSVYGNDIDISYEKIATKSGSISKKYQINSLSEINLEDIDANSVWYKIRKKIKTQMQDGEFVEKTWLSKLTAEENKTTNTLTLYASSNFIRDYVNNRYGSIARQIAKELGYQFVELVTKV